MNVLIALKLNFLFIPANPDFVLLVVINMSEIKLNAINFEYEVMKSDKPVLVDFYADWCGPCRMLGPVIEELANQRNDIKVCKLNVDENPELAQAFRVMSIPTLMVVNKGKIVKTSNGFRPKEEIERMLQEAL